MPRHTRNQPDAAASVAEPADLSQPVVLDSVPFELEAGPLLKRLHLQSDSEEAQEFLQLLGQARRQARPKAVYRLCFVESRDPGCVRVDGVTFHSPAMRMNLDKVERVFAFVATCGREVDELERDADDLLVEFWLDTVKAVLLGTAVAHLLAHLRRRFALGKTASMAPGAGDAAVWPIEQQRALFSLLGDGPDRIGVTLEPSCLMLPNKTVSGIRFETDSDYRACQLCHREPCPGRSSAFDPELWERVAHGTDD